MPRKNSFRSSSPTKKLDEHWEQISGKWKIENKTLNPDLPSGGTSYLATKENLPQDFYARLVYRPLKSGTYRSIGFSFDFQKPGVSQDIYTSTGDQEQSVQAFHRVNGKDVYPRSGIVKTSLEVGELTTLEVVVRGHDLRIWLNGQLQLDYIVPLARTPGKFAAWVYAGTAEFQDIELYKLKATPADSARQLEALQLAIDVKQNEIDALLSELVSLQSRVDAERAKYEQPETDETKQLAVAAHQAEQQTAYLRQQRDFLNANHYLKLVALQNPNAVSGATNPLADAQQMLNKALNSLNTSQAAISNATGEYQPLGEPYPAISTGRRLALARWLTAEDNPRTARIAVNHLWLRHFGRAIVPTVADFGIRSKPRSHPLLLDWFGSGIDRSELEDETAA